MTTLHILRIILEHVGPLQALDVRYLHSGEQLSVTSSRLADLNDCIWNMGTPSPDLFLCILMINALSGDLTDVRSSLARDLAKATSDQPYTPTDIRCALDVEQQLISGDKKSRDVVLSVQSGQLRPSRTNHLLCSNCKKPGHLSEYCISEGGGMAGKSIEESRAARKCDKETKLKNNTSNLPVVKDGNGKAYIVNLTTNTILNEAPGTVSAKTHAAETFVGFSSTETQPISIEDAIEYEGWLAMDELNTTIDWRTHFSTIDVAVAIGDTGRRGDLTHISSSKHSPFLLDTGAAVHISPDSTDFTSLRAISS